MTLLEELNWQEVVDHHRQRVDISKQLNRLLREDEVRRFARQTLAASDEFYMANYSAYEHGLGARILGSNGDTAHQRVFSLAKSFLREANSLAIPTLIHRAHIKYLAISVGSEIAMMIKPGLFWVANTRSVWAHLLVSKGYDVRRANEQLALYRDGEETSEMAYLKWKGIHSDMQADLLSLMKLAEPFAEAHGLDPATDKYLWIDSIANGLYSQEHG